MLLNNSNTPHVPRSPRLHLEKRRTMHWKVVMYPGNFVWIYFAALLADGTSGIWFPLRQKRQMLVARLGRMLVRH